MRSSSRSKRRCAIFPLGISDFSPSVTERSMRLTIPFSGITSSRHRPTHFLPRTNTLPFWYRRRAMDPPCSSIGCPSSGRIAPAVKEETRFLASTGGFKAIGESGRNLAFRKMLLGGLMTNLLKTNRLLKSSALKTNRATVPGSHCRSRNRQHTRARFPPRSERLLLAANGIHSQRTAHTKILDRFF